MGTGIDLGRRRACLVLAAGGAGLVCTRRAWAVDAAAFFKDRTIRFVVGFGPGGGYDSYARLLAPHLEVATGATVIVDNRPGAGGLLALNQVYAAEPDGLTIMIANAPGAALAQLLGEEGVRFDIRRLEWLAGLGGEEPIIMLGARSPVQSLAEGLAATAPVKWAAAGRLSSQGVWIALATHALAMESNLIVGYKGSSEAALAAMRGEADGIIVTASSAKSYVQDGMLRPIAALGRSRSPLFPDVPTIFEAASFAPDRVWWIDYCSRYAEIGRAIVATPGVPAERVTHLAAVCRKLLTDPAVIAEAEAAGRPIAYTEPDAVAALALGLLDGVDAPRLAELRALLTERQE